MRAWICTHLHGERRPVFVTISDSEVPLADAIASYLFNSQLVCTADGAMRLIVAQESRDHAGVWRAIESMVADDRNPIAAAEVFDLRQSMRNGGGPACLRLRVVLNPAEQAAVNPQCWIDSARATQLSEWVDHHYRDSLTLDALADPPLPTQPPPPPA